MKCSKCGAEIEVGSVFCKKCGEPVQMVPDYNILEDDFLVSLLDEQQNAKQESKTSEEKAVKSEKNTSNRVGKESTKKQNGFAALWKNKKARGGIIAGIIALVILIVFLVLYLTSYDHYVAKGKAADTKEEYTEALTYYNRAIKKNDAKAKAKILAANDYMKLTEYDKAEELLLSVIEKDSDNVAAYKSLIVLYLTTGSYDKLDFLQAQVTNQKIIDLFNDHLVSAPVFSVDGGKYDDDVIIELHAKTGKIYYT